MTIKALTPDECRRIEIALNVMDSEQLMWLMAGSNHVESNLDAIREAYIPYRKLGGGWLRGTTELYDKIRQMAEPTTGMSS